MRTCSYQHVNRPVAHAHRVRQNSAAAHAVFEKDLFGVVKDLGYRTGLAGKNHTYLKPSDLDFWRAYSHSEGWKPPNAPKEVVAFDEWLVKENFADEYEPSRTPWNSSNQLGIGPLHCG